VFLANMLALYMAVSKFYHSIVYDYYRFSLYFFQAKAYYRLAVAEP